MPIADLKRQVRYGREMLVMWSRIHAVLGLTPCELTYDAVRQAVDLGTMETEDLDWKQALPPADDKKRKEFAKDVAAMANTKGGLIIFGVEEANECATRIVGVANGERDRQRLRALASQWIRPLVVGLDILALDGDTTLPGLLIVSIPMSSDSPHVIGERNELGVPFRDGSDTRWMSEHQLERAYADRFDRRAHHRSVLPDLADQVIENVDLDNSVWFVASAHPLTSLSPYMPALGGDDLAPLFDDALQVANGIAPPGSGRSPILHRLSTSDISSPGVGLRRWVVRAGMASSEGLLNQLHVELHHDGSSTFAADVESWLERGPQNDHAVPTRVIESAIADAMAVATTHTRRLGYDGAIGIQITLVRPQRSKKPLVAFENRSGGQGREDMGPVNGSRLLQRFTPVSAGLSATAEIAVLRDLSRQLAQDALHQFGVPRTSVLA